MRTLVAIALLAAAATAAAAERPAALHTVKRDGIELRVARALTPAQVRAFYEARGFPEAAISALAKACFFTIGVINRREDKVWLAPATWQIRANGRVVTYYDLAYWQGVWQRLGVPEAKRATFRWTQLPASRDLHPGEPAAGNLVLERVDGAIDIEARFAVGRPGHDGLIRIKIPPLRCGR